jgi:hypothetical protein
MVDQTSRPQKISWPREMLKPVPQPETIRRTRAQELLERLDLAADSNGRLRCEILVVLSDDETPHPETRLASAGFPISAGASTRGLFDAAGKNLRRANRIDRETRDYVFPQLIDVGLIERIHINSRAMAEETGELFVHGEHPIAKSPNSGYVLTEDAQELLMEVTDEQWSTALETWLGKSKARRQQLLKKATGDAVAAATPTSKHSVLIEQCTDALLNSVAEGFELVFIDDADGDRVQKRWQNRLEKLGLMPDLSSRWPDAILFHPTGQAVWFVDAVISDGEIDEPRAKDLRLWTEKRGYRVGGMTTAYETWKRTSSRQASQANLAVGTTFWIAEDGGKLFEVRSLA